MTRVVVLTGMLSLLGALWAASSLLISAFVVLKVEHQDDVRLHGPP